MLSGNSRLSSSHLEEEVINNSSSQREKTDYDARNLNQRSPTIFLARVVVPQHQLQNNENNNLVEGQQVVSDVGQDAELDAPSNGSNIVEQPDDDAPLLYVEQNDVVSIERELPSDEKWFLAKSEQQIGKIPKSSCFVLDDQISVDLCQYLVDYQYFNLSVCFASFIAQDDGDLSVTKGDIIVAIVAVNEHWMQGQVCFDNQANNWPKLAPGKQVGTFPLNHCWQLDVERVKEFCYNKIEREGHKRDIKTSTSTSSTLSQQIPGWSFAANQPKLVNNVATETRRPILSMAHSSSLSSGSSSLYSTEYNQTSNRYDMKHPQAEQQHVFNSFRNEIERVNSDRGMTTKLAPPRPVHLPRQIPDRQKISNDKAMSKPMGILTSRQQDKLKGWLNVVKKKTARLSTRITASLGLISLTRDEEFERHYESFKKLEKSIRVFIKNLTQFVEHLENFLMALQNTSDNLADFYRDKSYQKEMNEMRKKNKALNCEHFHAFKRTVDRQVIAVAGQLLQKFAGPHQLVHKRSAKLLDYDTKTKEMESCRDLDKKTTLREEYVIAKDLYDRINGQLIEELPLFNQFALDIFRECILVLLESRRNLLLAYTQQTANLLDTPLMASYTASDVASTILMSCEPAPVQPARPPSSTLKSRVQHDSRQGSPVTNREYRPVSAHGTQPGGSGSSAGGVTEAQDEFSRPHSAMSQLSSEFDQMAAREISSTPLSQLSGLNRDINTGPHDGSLDMDEHAINGVRFDEPDAQTCSEDRSDGSSDNKHNENIESTIKASRIDGNNLCSTPAPQNFSVPEECNNKNRRRRSKHPIYVASWPFVATGPNQLSITSNQPLKLIKDCDECGNSDWSLVKDKRGHLGYVPTSYIKPKE